MCSLWRSSNIRTPRPVLVVRSPDLVQSNDKPCRCARPCISHQQIPICELPSAAAGRCTRRHCTMLSLMAPAFMLLVAGAAQLGALAFLALYIAAAGALYAVMYASFLQCRRAGVEFKPRHAVPDSVLRNDRQHPHAWVSM